MVYQRKCQGCESVRKGRSCCRKPQRSNDFCHLPDRQPCCHAVFFQFAQLLTGGCRRSWCASMRFVRAAGWMVAIFTGEQSVFA
jgi:hypothetical protein